MKISVSNFMAFQDTYEFDLRKINLFVGANNTGKSTLAKFFQWSKLNSNGFDFPNFMTKNNIWKSNFNQTKFIKRFRDLLNVDSETSKIQIVFSENYYGCELTIEFSYTNYEGSVNGLNENKIGPLYGILSNLIVSSGSNKLYEYSLENESESIHFSNYAVVFERYINSIDSIDFFQNEYERPAPNFIIPFLRSDFECQIDSSLDNITSQIINDLKNAGTHTYKTSDTIINYILQTKAYIDIREFNVINKAARVAVFDALKELVGVMISKFSNIIIASQTMSLDDDVHIVASANKSLSEYFNLKYNINAQLDNNGNYYGDATYIRHGDNSMLLEDMGDGIKNILPLLNKIESEGWIDFLNGNSNRENIKTFFISEPENALHPNWQKKFIEYLINNRYDNFVVETHSLIIVRSLQLAVAEGLISPDDVAVYDFYEEKDGIKSMQPIRILPDGQLDGKFMNGFDDLVNDMELKLWRIAQTKLSIN